MKAKLEEADMRMAEIKKEEYEFERDIVKGAANPRTGKANAEKVSKYLEDKLRAKVELIEWRFGLVGNVVGRINEVNQRRARLVLGWVTVFKTGKPSLYVTSHPGQLSLAIPPRIGKMSPGDDYGHRQRRNGEFYVTVGPVTRTADIQLSG